MSKSATTATTSAATASAEGLTEPFPSSLTFAEAEIADEATTPATCDVFEEDPDNEMVRAATAALRAILLETIDDDDALFADRFNSMEFDADNEGKREVAAAARAVVETTEYDSPPASFNSEDIDAGNERERAVVAASDELRDTSVQFQTGLASNRVRLFLSGRNGMIHDINTYSRPVHASESHAYSAEEDECVVLEEREDSLEAEGNSAIFVPEATLVKEEEVIIATTLEPTMPWWKQLRTKILLFVVLLLVVVSAALGATLSLNNKEEEPELTVSLIAALNSTDIA